jgi:caffeoyl-CoA O-methyltransferase
MMRGMDDRTVADRDLEAYAEAHSSAQPAYLRQVAEHTREFSVAHGMLVGPVVGRLLAMLVSLSGARRILEVGTYTGYSALCMAEALPEDGSIVTCEVDPDHARMAAQHIADSPWGDRIEIRFGRALKTIAGLEGPFDLVHIDAEPTGYPAYLEAVLPRLAERGFVVAHNVLGRGRVLDRDSADADTRAFAEFNESVGRDMRLECVVLTVSEGVTIIRPRR